MLLLSQRRSGLLRLLLLLNGLELSLTNRYLLLDGAHDPLGIDWILPCLRYWVTLQGRVIESPILALSLSLFIYVLSTSSLSISHCWNVFPHLWALPGFGDLFLDLLILQFGVRNNLRSIKELLISSELRILRDGILSLKNLIDLPRSQHIRCFVRLMMNAVVHGRKETLVLVWLLLVLQLTVGFGLSTDTSFWIVSSQLLVYGDVQLLLIATSARIIVYWSVTAGSIFVIWILVFTHILNKLTIIYSWNHHIAAIVEVLVSAHARITSNTPYALSVMMVNFLSLIGQ